MSAIAQVSPPRFHVIDQYCLEFPSVKKAFDSLILPIYGNQERALHLIGKGEDRLCEVMFINGEPKGLFVYKKQLTKDGELELKTFCLTDPSTDSGKGYGSLLYERLKEIAYNRGTDKIFVTVSSAKPESKAFFEKKGFKVVLSIPEKYILGKTEYFLVGNTGYAPQKAPTQIPTVPSFAFAMRTDPVLTQLRTHSTSAAASSATEEKPKRSESSIPKSADKKRSRDEETSPEAGLIPSDPKPETAIPRKKHFSDSSRAADSSVQGSDGFARHSEPSAHRLQVAGYGTPRDSRARSPKDHECSLKDPYVGYIAAGTKTFEGRVNTGYFRDYLPGDTVTWFNQRNAVKTKITSRTEYPSGFNQMLTEVGFKKLIPHARSHDEALAVYNSIPGYRDKVSRFGALAFGLEVLKKPYDPLSASKNALKEPEGHGFSNSRGR